MTSCILGLYPDASCRVSLYLTNPGCLADGQQYEYGEDLGVTAVALYDYQAGETEGCECLVQNQRASSHQHLKQ